MKKFEFNWSKFTEENYKKLIKEYVEIPYSLDCFGHVYVGDICIELIVDTYLNNENMLRDGLMFNFYVAHEDTGYGYKNEYGYDHMYENDGMPYDFADGDMMDIPYGVSYEKFKKMAEEKFTRYIVGCDNYFSYSLVEHASRPLEIW